MAPVHSPGVAHRARAVFVFPLHVGAIRTGLLTLHRTRPELLSLPHIRAAFALADIAFVLLLNTPSTTPTDPHTTPDTTAMPEVDRVRVYQATGHVAAKLGVGPDEALVWLHTRASTDNRPLPELARDLLSRRSRSPHGERDESSK